MSETISLKHYDRLADTVAAQKYEIDDLKRQVQRLRYARGSYNDGFAAGIREVYAHVKAFAPGYTGASRVHLGIEQFAAERGITLEVA